MLTFIRERVQGILAWIIVGLLIIPFALWGINEYFGGGGNVTVATVNGVEISQREFQQAFYEQRNRMQQLLGEQYDARSLDPEIRKGVIEEMVNQQLLLQYGADQGYSVSDVAVIETIRNMEFFHDQGDFSKQVYEQQLRAQGMNPAAFEQRIQRAMLVEQLPEGLQQTAIVTDAELDAVIRLQEQTRNIDYLVIPVARFKDQSMASDEAIADYFQNNKQDFMTDERVQVEYVELDASKLKSDVTPTEQELRDFYQSRANQYVVPEQRNTRHILIQVTQDADENTLAAARQKIDDIAARLKAGESFEDLAKAYSEDPGSAAQGGELGFVSQGTMVPEFDTVAFSLDKGEISDPIRSSFGFHIIQVVDILAAKSKPFDEVRAELLADLQTDSAERRYFELAEHLTNLAFEVPDSLIEAAEQTGLQVKTSDFFSRDGGKGLFANQRLVNAAFSDDVLQQRFNSEPIEVGVNHVVVLRVKQYEPAAEQTLEQVKEQVRKILVDSNAKSATYEAGFQRVERLQDGEAASSIAAELNLAWKSLAGVKRRANQPDREVIEEAFRISKPEQGKASFGGVVLSNGDYVLIAVNKVQEGDPASLDQAARDALKQQIIRNAAIDSRDNLLDTLKADASISINQEEI